MAGAGRREGRVANKRRGVEEGRLGLEGCSVSSTWMVGTATGLQEYHASLGAECWTVTL
jgi:hypothetical protein